MRKPRTLPPTEVQALAAGAPPIYVLLLDLGQAIAHRVITRPPVDPGS